MSIERLFRSKKSGNIYRLGPSIQTGEMGIVVDISGALEKIIAARCGREDEGGVVTEIQDNDFSRLDGSNLFIPNKVLAKLEGIEPKTGALYEKTVKLLDGDEGTLFIQHNDSDSVTLN